MKATGNRKESKTHRRWSDAGHNKFNTYKVEMLGRNKAAIAKYIQNQQEEDRLTEQISMKEYIDPFTGKPVKES